MSNTIMVPAQFDEALRTICSDAVAQAVALLAEKHGFDLEEALRDVNQDVKLVRKRGPSPKKDTDKSVEKVKKAKKAKDPTAPKRAKTGYLLFGDDARQRVKDELAAVDGPGGTKPQTVIKKIAMEWAALSEEEQATWREQASQLKAAAEEMREPPALTRQSAVRKLTPEEEAATSPRNLMPALLEER